MMPANPAFPVLVTDAPANASLAVVRSLGRRGVPVGICSFADEFNLAAYSRWALESFTLPSPTHHADGFIRALRQLLETGKYPIVFATTERTIQLIAAARASLPPWVQIPMPGPEAIATVLDKERTATVAERLGVSIPSTWCPDDVDEAATLAGSLPYPVIVKPRQTNFLADGQLMKADYIVVESAAGLVAAWRAVDAVTPRPVIQALVRGRGVGMNTLWRHGQPLVWFCHHRLREIDLRGGRSTAAMSAVCDERLQAGAHRMLDELGWHGVAMVEFKFDEETDEFWLLEINGRFWGSLPLALACGVDFPYYLYQVAIGETPAPPRAYEAGVVARDAVAEMKHFVRVMAHGRGQRLATLGQAGTILHPWKRSFNWVRDDPTPGRREWLHVLSGALGRRRAA